MMKLAKNLPQLIGNTPLLELGAYCCQMATKSRVIGKLEYFNPLSSIKDRVALSMIEAAEKEGILTKDSFLVEPTSGNTGIGLAYICASRGYRLALIMPSSMSAERVRIMKALGAEVIFTEPSRGMQGTLDKAEELRLADPTVVVLDQFKNKANPAAHKQTAEEIWRDTEGKIDILVACVGTGGTISGIGAFLKEKNPNIEIIAVEPAASPLLSEGKAGPHKIAGIGTNFMPPLFRPELISEILTVSNEDAYTASRMLAKTEGLLVGISSGAAAFAAVQVAKRAEGKVIVTIFPDSGERYLSTDLYGE